MGASASGVGQEAGEGEMADEGEDTWRPWARRGRRGVLGWHC